MAFLEPDASFMKESYSAAAAVSLALVSAWRRAKSWVKWINKPQTRGQCKKVLKGHLSGVSGASYICNGLVVLSVSADRTIKAFSPFTGEILKEIGKHPKGITIMEISQDWRWLATGSEEGTVIIWELEAGPPANAGTEDDSETGTKDEKEKSEGEEMAEEGAGKNGVKDTSTVRYPAEYLRIRAFNKRITGIAFTSDDTIILSSDESDVKIFELHSDGQTELNNFVPFRYGVSKVATTPYDTPTQMIAAAGRSSVKLFRTETLDYRGGLYGHNRTVTDVKFSSSGKERLLIATVSNDRTLRIWQQAGARDWNAFCSLEGHSDCIRCVAWSPDDRCILTGSVDNTMKVWTLQEDGKKEVESERMERSDSVGKSNEHEKPFKLLATFDGHGDTVTSVRFHPHGTLAISCSRDKEVRVYDTRVPFSAVEPASHSQPVSVVTAAKHKTNIFDDDSRLLVASVDSAGFVKLWDVQADDPVLVWSFDSQHSMPVKAMGFTNSVRYLITASKDGSIKRWDLQRFAEDAAAAKLSEEARKRLEKKKKEQEENPIKMKAHKGGVSVLTMHHQGEFFLTSGLQEPKVTIWDAETMLDVQSAETANDSTTLQATFSNDGKFVVLADTSNTFRLFNIEGNKEVFSSHIDSTDVMQSIDFSSDGRFIATVAQDASIISLWDASVGLKLKSSLEGHSGVVIKTGFSHDGRHMCSIAQDKMLIVWMLKDSTPISSLLLDHVPSALFVGHAWPHLAAADNTGRLYWMMVCQPTPLSLEEENVVTQARMNSPGMASRGKAGKSPLH